ncbi:MAG: hypothetical protein ACRDHY_12750 [Anaerolineales bacterium]
MTDDRIEALVAEDTERMRKLLSVVITACGLTRQDVDKRLGVPRGYTAAVLSGRRALKQKHVTAFLLSLGVHPSLFFDILYPRDVPIGSVSATEDFARRLEALRFVPHPQPPPPPPASLSTEELLRAVEDTLRRALGAMRKTQRGPSPTKRGKTPRRKKTGS